MALVIFQVSNLYTRDLIEAFFYDSLVMTTVFLCLSILLNILSNIFTSSTESSFQYKQDQNYFMWNFDLVAFLKVTNICLWVIMTVPRVVLMQGLLYLPAINYGQDFYKPLILIKPKLLFKNLIVHWDCQILPIMPKTPLPNLSLRVLKF